MKLKKTTLLPIIILLTTLASCNDKTSHNSIPKTYTEEENLSDWLKGRDYALTFDGTYTANLVNEEYFNDVLEEKRVAVEANDNPRYYSVMEEYSINEDTKELELIAKQTAAIKEVNDNGKVRNKYYLEAIEGENVFKQGRYVAPYYAQYFNNTNPTPEGYGDYFVNGNTLEELKNNFDLEYFSKGHTKTESIKLVRNEDTSVSLLVEAKGTYVFSGEESITSDEDYLKTEIAFNVEIAVSEGKITKINKVATHNNVYKDTSKNEKYLDKELYEVSYDFDKVFYDSISVETETTTNDYYGRVYFDICGIELDYDDRVLVDDEYTVDYAQEFLLGKYSTFIGRFAKSSFALYLDKDFTKPFHGVDKLPDNIKLYVNFDIPEDKAIVIYSYVDSGKEKTDPSIKIVYLEEINTTFDPKSRFSDYKIVSIDGKEVDSNNDLSFEITESRIYMVVITANS